MLRVMLLESADDLLLTGYFLLLFLILTAHHLFTFIALHKVL